MTALIVPDDTAGRARAVDVLRGGGLVAIPTDTVYGLAVALDADGGIERLFEAKRRPADRAIVLLLADAAQAPTVGHMTPAAAALTALWPGALTIVVEQRADASLPAALTGGRSTVGLRVPDHDAPRALAAALGPLPTTSANLSGDPVARDAAGVAAALGDAIDLVLDGGPASGGPASTVVDGSVDPPAIVRAGAVAEDVIRSILAGGR
jgi:L-threonylcarbamoyladenylate synthase